MALSKTYVPPLDPQMGCSNLDTAFRRESVDLVLVHPGTLWSICGLLCFDPSSMRVPLPIPLSATSHGTADHVQTRIVPCEYDARVRYRQA
jgi:hypothetical protein